MDNPEVVKAEFLRMGREEPWWDKQPAKRRLENARRRIKYPDLKLDWKEGNYSPVLCSATYEDGPFHVEVAFVVDDCPDLSWIGEFGNDWKDGAIDIRLADNGTHHGRFGQDEVDWNYFYPATEYRNLDWRNMKKLLKLDWTPCDLRITISRNGIELAKEWLGGGFYEDGKYDEVFDLGDIGCHAEEAIEEAQEVLKELCAV